MKADAPTLARLLDSWQLDPGVIAVWGTVAAFYGYGVFRSRKRWPVMRSVSFLAGLLVLNVALSSGVDRYADELLSVHVVQHLLLMLLAPALLLWGAPVRLALRAAPVHVRAHVGAVLKMSWVRFLTRPACGFALFTSVVLTTHLTGLYELALRDATVHNLEHAAYFWSGVLFLLPILAADPIPHPPSAIARFSWLMAAMTVMSVPGALLIFDEHVRYPFYLAPAGAMHRSALSDQHAAGMLMLLVGGVAMATLAIVVAMETMVREERRQLRRDAYLYADGDQLEDAEARVAGELAGA